MRDAALGRDYDGHSERRLARLLDVPRVALHHEVTSTLDVAHALGAAGAPAGTLVLAERQSAGRGRSGRAWASAAGSGIWLTLLERPRAVELELLSLRVGIRVAPVLDQYAEEPIALKWPNDLYAGREGRGGKLGGVLVEARWRGERVDWVAIGLGINVQPPADIAHAAALRPGVTRVAVLSELVPALRAAAASSGPLTPAERDAFAGRDLARGRRAREPVAGLVAGIAADGALIVHTAAGDVACRAGSLRFEDDP